eukprot:g11802.t1
MEEREGTGPALSLVHRHVFGLKPDVKNNVHYAEETLGQTRATDGRSDAPEFLCVAFSADSKYLITQTGRSPSAKHDWSLLYWVWDKQRCMASIKVSNPQNALIRECSFNPTDSSIVCVVGDGILKFMQLKDGFKTLPVAPPKLQSFMCHAWLHDDKMIVGCDNGDLLLFDNAGEFQCVLPTSPGEPRAATCVIPCSKGFIIGGDDGRIRIYEKSDEPKETGHFHTGAILGLDVCIRKPLVVTCGIDKSARVWNYFEKTCVMCRWFNEEAYSIAFHPSGFHLIIGQSDKLRLMNLLMEDGSAVRCRECRFSNGGQYFAAVNTNATNAIQVYKTYTGEPIDTLKGHTNKVRSVAWTADDSMLVSTGADGAVYEYFVQAETGNPGRDGRRNAHDFVQKTSSFSCVIVHADQSSNFNTMYVVGNDQLLRKIYKGESSGTVKDACQQMIERDGNGSIAQNGCRATMDHTNTQRPSQAGTTLGQIVLANSGKGLFAAVAEPDAPGRIRCYKFPLNGGDNSYRNMSKRDKESALPLADEILVTRTFLDDKQGQLNEFERQVDELSNQQEFQLRHRDSFHKEEMVAMDEKYTAEIDEERQKYEVLREEKNDAEMEAEENIKGLLEHHAKQDQDLEQSFQEKMMEEVNKYQKLAAERDEIHRKWGEQHQRVIAEHQKKVNELQAKFQAEQKADMEAIERILNEKALAENVHAETMRQLELDRGMAFAVCWKELSKQMAQKEDERQRYQEEARKKDDKIAQLNKEREHNAKEIRQRDSTIGVLYAVRDHKLPMHKYPVNPNMTAGDKEGKIYELKKQNQELEKFKFVLDYKIRELKDCSEIEISPRDESNPDESWML